MLFRTNDQVPRCGRPGPGDAAEFSAWIGDERGRWVRAAIARTVAGIAFALVFAFAAAHAAMYADPVVIFCLC